MCQPDAVILVLDSVPASSAAVSVCKMEVQEEVERLHLRLAVVRQRNRLARIRLLVLDMHRRSVRKQPKKWWMKSWVTPIQRQNLGQYDTLMIELRHTDPQSFRNFMRMPPELFDELLDRIGRNINVS